MGSEDPALSFREWRLPLPALLFPSDVNSTFFQLKPALKTEYPGSPEFSGKSSQPGTRTHDYLLQQPQLTFCSEESDSPCQRYYSRLMVFPLSLNSNPHPNPSVQGLQSFRKKHLSLGLRPTTSFSCGPNKQIDKSALTTLFGCLGPHEK